VLGGAQPARHFVPCVAVSGPIEAARHPVVERRGWCHTDLRWPPDVCRPRPRSAYSGTRDSTSSVGPPSAGSAGRQSGGQPQLLRHLRLLSEGLPCTVVDQYPLNFGAQRRTFRGMRDASSEPVHDHFSGSLSPAMVCAAERLIMWPTPAPRPRTRAPGLRRHTVRSHRNVPRSRRAARCSLGPGVD